jgi:hypothetical protein
VIAAPVLTTTAAVDPTVPHVLVAVTV